MIFRCAFPQGVNLGSAIQHIPGDADATVYFRDREAGVTTLYFTSVDGPGGNFPNPDP